MFRAIPPALLVGAIAGVFNRGMPLAESMDWWLFSFGAASIEMALITAGLFELARRTSGLSTRLMCGAGAIYGAFAAWFIVGHLFAVLTLGNGDEMAQFALWVSRLSGVVYAIAALLIATAVGGWRAAPWAAGIFVGSEFVAQASVYVGVTPGFDRHHIAFHLCVYAMKIATLLFMIAVCMRDRSLPLADAPVAMRSFRVAAFATWCKLGLTFVISYPTFSIAARSSWGVMVFRYASLIAIAVTALCAASLLRVAISRIEGLPVIRVVLGAAGILWWASLEFYVVTPSFPEMQAPLARVAMLGPLVAAAGTILIGTAIAAFAKAQTNPRLRKQALTRTIAFGAAAILSIVIGKLWIPESGEGLRALTFVTTAPVLAALALMAGLFSRVADHLGAQPQLPAARAI